eukprot:2835461-Pyramimonas_sp.AAC.1
MHVVRLGCMRVVFLVFWWRLGTAFALFSICVEPISVLSERRFRQCWVDAAAALFAVCLAVASSTLQSCIRADW